MRTSKIALMVQDGTGGNRTRSRKHADQDASVDDQKKRKKLLDEKTGVEQKKTMICWACGFVHSQ
jgi:hypothetical protein